MFPWGGYADKAVSEEARPVQALGLPLLSLDYCKHQASFVHALFGFFDTT